MHGMDQPCEAHCSPLGIELPSRVEFITDFVSADKEKGKEKLEEDEAAAASTMAVSASLMPPIWDKTIPYDGESFHLEYMDLDEFLLENGIPASPTHLAQNLLLPVAELEGKESASSSAASPPSSSSAVFQPSETVSSTGGWRACGQGTCPI